MSHMYLKDLLSEKAEIDKYGSMVEEVSVDELDRLKATIKLLTKLEEGEQSAREKGWLTAEEVEAALGL